MSEKKYHTLIVPLPAMGHFYGTLQLARLLQKEGQQVSYGSSPVFAKVIEDFDFPFHPLEFFLFLDENFATNQKKEKGLDAFLHNLSAALVGSRTKSTQKLLEKLTAQLEKINPDCIVLDRMLSIIVFLLPTFADRICLVNTMLNTYEDALVPPINSRLHPRQPFFTLRKNWAWLKIKYWQKMRPFLYVRQDPWSMVKKVSQQLDFKLIEEANQTTSYLMPAPRQLPELIVGYAAFDFPRQAGEIRQMYLGVQFDPDRKAAQPPETLVHLIEQIQQKEAHQLIYCSLGTRSAQYGKHGYEFIKKVIQAFKGLSNKTLIISVGKMDQSNFAPLPPHVHLYQFVPQTWLLQYCDLMITSTGLNTIFECIHTETPIVGFPLDDEWDQNGNAARIEFHGIGRIGAIQRITSKALQNLISEVLQNPAYQRAIVEMHQKCQEDKAQHQNQWKTVFPKRRASAPIYSSM